MASKKILSAQNSVKGLNLQNFNVNYDLLEEKSYFVNLDIVNTSRGLKGSQTEGSEKSENIAKLKNNEYEKFRSSRANEEFRENYVATTMAHLSRRDSIPNNSSCGTLTQINPILNQSVRRVLIYGSPGTGKTTLCKKILHDFYAGNLWGYLDEVIWIPLRQLKDAKYESKAITEETLLKRYLNEENLNIDLDNVLFILDGWDEIHDILNDPRKSELIESIKKIAARKNVILTSRPFVKLNFADYQRVLEIKGFTLTNVREYIETFLKQNDRMEEEEKILEYVNHRLISDLVTIPIILEIFLFSWEEISQIPKEEITTTKLYETVNLKLLKRFTKMCDKPVAENIALKSLITGPLVEEFRILKEMAKTWLETGSLQFIFSDYQKDGYGADVKLPFLIGSDTIDWKNERREFIHLTFLEFLAAFELINQNEEDFQRFIVENKFNPKYFVVLTFVAGLISSDLHNLKEFCSTKYRLTKEEKLELYFDYLQGDPIDISGKYIYMLLNDCLNECTLSKSREKSIFNEMATLAKKSEYHSGIEGTFVFQSLRHFPSGLFDEFLEVGGTNSNDLRCYDKTLPQLTDNQVKLIFSMAGVHEETKLDFLLKQSSFSPYCTDIMLKLLTYNFLKYNRFSTYSNLPLSILKKIVKLLLNKDLFENGSCKTEFPTLVGISCGNARELCKKLVNTEDVDSIQDIIVKLILAVDIEEDILFFLNDVHEFVDEVPGALTRILCEEEYTNNPRIFQRAMRVMRMFESPVLIEKLIDLSNTCVGTLKYHILRTLLNIYRGKNVPDYVSVYFLDNFKQFLNAEKERMFIRNRLTENYFTTADRNTVNLRGLDFITKDVVSVKDFITSLKGRFNSTVIQHLIDLFLGSKVSQLPLEILESYERWIFKIVPFIVESKTLDGNLHMKGAIGNIINSNEENLKEMFGLFGLDLLHETMGELLENLSVKDKVQWKWTVKRLMHTLIESQRYIARCSNEQPKGVPQYGAEQCVNHTQAIYSNVLQQLLKEESIKLENISDVPNNNRISLNLYDALMYVCYEKHNDEGALLWEEAVRCGLEDSEYQEKVTDYLLTVLSQDLESELRAELICVLSTRVHRLTKEQLRILLKYEGDEENYKFDNCAEARSYLTSLSNSIQSSKSSIHKFINDCDYFSKEEQFELRKLSKPYDKFCKEESDLETEQKVEEFCSQIHQLVQQHSFKAILGAISEYLKDLDEFQFHSRVKNINSKYHGWGTTSYLKICRRFFPKNLWKSFIFTGIYLDWDDDSEIKKVKHSIDKLGKRISAKVMQLLCEKFDDDNLASFIWRILESDDEPKIVAMVNCINDTSSESQKAYMTYALYKKLLTLKDNISVFVFNNNLYMGSSINDEPAISNLNPQQLECLLNSKCLSNSDGFGIQLLGIAPCIESFKYCSEKCSVMDLSEKEQFLNRKKYLDLTNQNIKDVKQIELIVDFIKKYPVEMLILSDNHINNDMFEILLREINESHLKHLILQNNRINLDKLDFDQFFGGDESILISNQRIKLLDVSNNTASAVWLEKFEKLQHTDRIIRKNTDGNHSVFGYNVNGTNIILQRFV